MHFQSKEVHYLCFTKNQVPFFQRCSLGFSRRFKFYRQPGSDLTRDRKLPADFCSMVGRYEAAPGQKTVFIGDRGYCSYNNMAHVLEKGQYFLSRTKDIHSKGLVKGFAFPDEECFDIMVEVTLVRSHSKKFPEITGDKLFVDKKNCLPVTRFSKKEAPS